MELTRDDIIRAWKDESYRDSLPADVRETLPAPPENVGELNDSDLETAAGGATPFIVGAIAVGTAGNLAKAAAFPDEAW